ncbi:4'-phosphopantetheinyl transferase family protein [Oxalobacteraceae bacterium A2-2]
MKATIWLVDGAAVADALLESRLPWLGQGELARYQRFILPERRRQFLLGRVLLRMALGQLLRQAPDSIVLEEQVGQAPRLMLPGVARGGRKAAQGGHAAHAVQAALPGFSIAHSGPWSACAVSPDTALGLDIGLIDASRDLAALAGQALSAAEWEALRQLPDEELAPAFYRAWSEKEARFKLRGAAAGAGLQVEAHCSTQRHGALWVALCSTHALDQPPAIELPSL